mgnify:CR=1 FL=1
MIYYVVIVFICLCIFIYFAGTLKEKLNEIVMFNVETQKEIEKGYMYTGYETEYKVHIILLLFCGFVTSMFIVSSFLFQFRLFVSSPFFPFVLPVVSAVTYIFLGEIPFMVGIVACIFVFTSH